MNTVLDNIYRGLRFFTDKIVGYVAAIVMFGMTALALLEILRRYALGVTFQWGQDAVTYFIVGSIALFFAVTQARRSHLTMSAILDLLKAKGMTRTVQVIRAFVSVCSLLFYSSFAYWGWSNVERTYATGRMTQSLEIIMWPFQFMLQLGFALMALVTLFQLYQDIQAILGRKVFPWAETEEGLEI